MRNLCKAGRVWLERTALSSRKARPFKEEHLGVIHRASLE